MSWCMMIMHNDDMITFLITFFNIWDVIELQTNGKNNVDTVIFSWGSRACQHATSPLRQAPRLPPVLMLVVTRKSHSPTWSAYHKL